MTCRWVFQSLTEAQKQDRIDSCLTMLKKFDEGRSKCVITGDEICFYYYNPETKCQNEVWMARNNPLPSKVLLTNTFFLLKFSFNTIIPLENSYSYVL